MEISKSVLNFTGTCAIVPSLQAPGFITAVTGRNWGSENFVDVSSCEGLRVVGLHLLGPNCGEIAQGFAVAMRKGATYGDFCDTVGIHPTFAENFTTLTVTKASGKDAGGDGC